MSTHESSTININCSNVELICRHLNRQLSTSIDDKGVDVLNVDVFEVDVFNIDESNGVKTFPSILSIN